ncbi:proprotein convertase p-domain-containing protein [Ditylenchus destructor]|uniref:Proprotein convertase p-domain-containing protein n=1 Tax=Ditylenchus destructor TaxID=166010 RepID=A0AAD4RDJ1_9BILA|nr:proprotein convertase p-domain-containing protein [Ditylenchus destructor]
MQERWYVWRRLGGMCHDKSGVVPHIQTIPHGNRLHLQIYTNGCAGDRNSQVKYLEHVQAIVTLSAPKRGDIQIYLTSPKGTRSTLLAKRARDTSRTGFRDWAFMTTHNWGEPAYGTWSLEIDNDGWDDAELLKWDLVMYGTDVPVGQFGAEDTLLSVAQRSVGLKDGSSSASSIIAATITYRYLIVFALAITFFVQSTN